MRNDTHQFFHTIRRQNRIRIQRTNIFYIFKQFFLFKDTEVLLAFPNIAYQLQKRAALSFPAEIFFSAFFPAAHNYRKFVAPTGVQFSNSFHQSLNQRLVTILLGLFCWLQICQNDIYPIINTVSRTILLNRFQGFISAFYRIKQYR